MVPAMIKVYGLKTCDTCRKALKWLDSQGIAHSFHDVRADGVSHTDVARWAKAAGEDKLLNRRGTTWRGLYAAEQKAADGGSAVGLMLAYPALIKRPVFEAGTEVVVGFGTAEQKALARLAKI
jgi:Spx/MgsR family transcriptional regulator